MHSSLSERESRKQLWKVRRGFIRARIIETTKQRSFRAPERNFFCKTIWKQFLHKSFLSLKSKRRDSKVEIISSGKIVKSCLKRKIFEQCNDLDLHSFLEAQRKLENLKAFLIKQAESFCCSKQTWILASQEIHRVLLWTFTFGNGSWTSCM